MKTEAKDGGNNAFLQQQPQLCKNLLEIALSAGKRFDFMRPGWYDKGKFHYDFMDRGASFISNRR